MSVLLTRTADPVRLARTRARNDHFRANLEGGFLAISEGIVNLGAVAQTVVLNAIRTFDDFDPDEEWDTHDIGDFEIEIDDPDHGRRRELVFFRIVDLPLSDGTTVLALTVMLAREW